MDRANSVVFYEGVNWQGAFTCCSFLVAAIDTLLLRISKSFVGFYLVVVVCECLRQFGKCGSKLAGDCVGLSCHVREA